MDSSTNYTFHYQGGSLKADDPTYVWRSTDDELFQKLQSGEFCYVLTPRQMGKSSLRVRTAQRLQQQGVACANIDLSAIGSQTTPDQWYKGILYRLFRSLELSTEWRSFWRDHNFLPVVQRLGEVIRNVLLESTDRDIVIFIDEIDSVISMDFSTDDFFAFIRACYGQRADDSEYNRLTFCLLGVATPSDLIQDKKRTPFNIGHGIQLKGLELEHARPVLSQGLSNIVNDPEQVIAEILEWTEGQPFLTQKICQLVVEKAETSNPNISAIVQNYVIENWEAQDEPEHLRTIRDRLLYDKTKAIIVLGKYQEVLEADSESTSNNSSEEIELQLSGLVNTRNNMLAVANSIYREVFNKDWIEQQLAKLWIFSDDIFLLEKVIEPEIPSGYTSKVILASLGLLALSAISLYLHWGPFLGDSRELEFSERSRLSYGLIEFGRISLLLIGSFYMMLFVWRQKAIELKESSSKKAKWFRRIALGLFVTFLVGSVHHHFWSAPAELRFEHGSKIDVSNDFIEYVLPSILYFPYSCIIYFVITIPFTLLSIYAVTDDVSNNWRKTIQFKRIIAELLSKYESIPKNLKLNSIKNQFTKYTFVFLNTTTPYSTIFLEIQVVLLFEWNLGQDTLTNSGQSFAFFTYGMSFTVIAIFLTLFALYQRALSAACNALFSVGDEQAMSFQQNNRVSIVISKIITSSINLILLGVIFILTLIYGLLNFLLNINY